MLSLRGLVAVALVLGGVGALLLSGGVQRERVATRLGGNAPVDAGAANPADFTAHNSPTAASNPRRPANLAISNRIDTPRFSCALHVSQDGGATWSPTPIPAPPREERKCYAPDVAFDAAGVLFLTYVTLRGRGNVPHAAWLVRSRDGGRTLSAPRRLLGPLSFQVRLAADPQRAGRLYLTWLKASSGVGLFQFSATGNPVLFKTTGDGGRTWSVPARVSARARERVVAPSLAVGPRSTLNVLYLDVGDDQLDYVGGHRGRGGEPYQGPWQLVLARSTNGGRTWIQAPIPERVVPTERFISFIPPFPAVAADRASGRVYAAFQDGRLGDPDVRVWTWQPRGARWGASVRVNDTPARDGTSQYRPALGIAPGGRVDVVYYDRRRDRADRLNAVSLQSSRDGGRSFGPSLTLSDRSFDSRVGFGAERDLPDLGSRIAVLSRRAGALGVWTDTRAGSEASGKQDIAAAVVTMTDRERPVAARGALRWGGALAILLGAGLLAAIVLAGRRGRSAPPARADADDEIQDDGDEQAEGDVPHRADSPVGPA